MNKYGTFEVEIGVPESFDGHRCEYARQKVASEFGEGLVEAWVIQRTIPTTPVEGAEADKDYYVFGGNINRDRLSDDP